MKTARAQMILGCLRKALQPHGDLTDGLLLGQFVARRDEAAFAALVRRHGPMVMGVCRRILRHAHDAEDAFQATFLVLARKASRLRDREAVGSWLYGVAYRAALGARAAGLRRKAKEQQVEDMPHPLVVMEEGQAELLAVLDQELARLPEKYRIVVVLCELEGRSRKEAARQLGLPEGTLSSRLATARKMLARRMAGRGAAVTGAALTALLASEAGAVCVPASLIASTMRAVCGVVPAGVAVLAEGVLKAMLLTKIKSAALVLLLAASVGTVGLTYRTAMAQNGPGPQTAAEAQQWADQPRTPAKAAKAEKDELASLRLQVEALRVSLQATKERVEKLEAAEQARQKPAGGAFTGTAASVGIGVAPSVPKAVIGAALPSSIFRPSTTSQSPTPAPAVPPGELRVPGETPSSVLPGNQATSLAGGKAALLAEIDGIVKKLGQDSKNKEALDALDRAVKELRRLNDPKPRSDDPNLQKP